MDITKRQLKRVIKQIIEESYTKDTKLVQEANVVRLDGVNMNSDIFSLMLDYLEGNDAEATQIYQLMWDKLTTGDTDYSDVKGLLQDFAPDAIADNIDDIRVIVGNKFLDENDPKLQTALSNVMIKGLAYEIGNNLSEYKKYLTDEQALEADELIQTRGAQKLGSMLQNKGIIKESTEFEGLDFEELVRQVKDADNKLVEVLNNDEDDDYGYEDLHERLSNELYRRTSGDDKGYTKAKQFSRKHNGRGLNLESNGFEDAVAEGQEGYNYSKDLIGDEVIGTHDLIEVFGKALGGSGREDFLSNKAQNYNLLYDEETGEYDDELDIDFWDLEQKLGDETMLNELLLWIPSKEIMEILDNNELSQRFIYED